MMAGAEVTERRHLAPKVSSANDNMICDIVDGDASLPARAIALKIAGESGRVLLAAWGSAGVCRMHEEVSWQKNRLGQS